MKVTTSASGLMWEHRKDAFWRERKGDPPGVSAPIAWGVLIAIYPQDAYVPENILGWILLVWLSCPLDKGCMCRSAGSEAKPTSPPSMPAPHHRAA